MKRHFLDFVYLFFLYLLASYIYFRVVLNGLHIIDISLAPYIGLAFVISMAVIHIKLKLKQNEVNTLGCFIFSAIAIGIFYLFLFDYYNYDVLHEKGVWWFGLIFILIGVGEAQYYFSNYEQLKKAYDEDRINFFKRKNTSDDTNKKTKEDKDKVVR